MVSSSKSSNQSSTTNKDNRIAVDGQGIGIGENSTVEIHQVADEAFQLASMAIDSNAKATDQILARAESETKQLSEMAMKFGIPAIALAFVASRLIN